MDILKTSGSPDLFSPELDAGDTDNHDLGELNLYSCDTENHDLGELIILLQSERGTGTRLQLIC